MKLLKRKPRDPREITITHRGLTIEHTIKKLPDPRPTLWYLTITNQMGQQFRTPPSQINGRTGYPIHLPREWIINDDPHSQTRIRLELEY